jgi:RNA polymerase sigma-70 factor (ECF subfamily)
MREGRPRYAPTDDDAWQVAMAFLAAAQVGDLDSLVSLLADDALAVSDGGADHHAARRPVIAARIPRFIANLTARAREGTEYQVQLINGQPGLVCLDDGQAYLAVAISVADGQVQRIFSILNPEKLQTLSSPVIA